MANFPTVISNKIQQESMETLDQRHFLVNYGDGYEQRASIGVNSFFNGWTLVIFPLSKAELSTFKTFWLNHGFVESWEWQAPEDSEVKTWVFNSQPQIENNAEVYRVTVDIREVCG